MVILKADNYLKLKFLQIGYFSENRFKFIPVNHIIKIEVLNVRTIFE